MLQAQGLDVSPGYVSTIKTNLKGKKKKAKKAAAGPCAGSRSRAAQGRRVGRPAGQGEEAGPGAGRREGSQDGPECLGAAAGLSWHPRDAYPSRLRRSGHDQDDSANARRFFVYCPATALLVEFQFAAVRDRENALVR